MCLLELLRFNDLLIYLVCHNQSKSKDIWVYIVGQTKQAISTNHLRLFGYGRYGQQIAQ